MSWVGAGEGEVCENDGPGLGECAIRVCNSEYDPDCKRGRGNTPALSLRCILIRTRIGVEELTTL